VASEFVEKVNLRKKLGKKVPFLGDSWRFLSKKKCYFGLKMVFLQSLLPRELYSFLFYLSRVEEGIFYKNHAATLLAVLDTDVITLSVKVILINICLVWKTFRRIFTELKCMLFFAVDHLPLLPPRLYIILNPQDRPVFSARSLGIIVL
jgi:hypothetical protein